MDNESEDFLLSSNAIAIAQEFGWWNGTGNFDFARAFSLGEYDNPHYSSRRMWRAYSLLAPSSNLDPSLEITDSDGAYPFAVKPDNLLTTDDIFRVYRDYYEGTPFSLVANVPAAGPFNSPLRVAGGQAEDTFPTGAWERPISIYRADYAVLSVCNSKRHGIVWFAPDTPHASVFAPVWTSQASVVARAYVVDQTQNVDRDSLFWAVSAVSKWAYGSMFSHAIVDIRAAQAGWELQASDLAAELMTVEPEQQTSLLAEFAAKLRSGWWDLFWSLVGKYNDGYVITHSPDGTVTSTAVGYPSWWLEAVHFENAILTPNSSFQKLKRRMADAAAKMAEIDAKRVRPLAKTAQQESERPEIIV
jgi:dipeptidase